MPVVVSEKADADLSDMDSVLRHFFIKHFEKLNHLPPRRHLRFGLPFNVEDVTRSARFVYETKSDILFVLRCFGTHKEYEKWYNSFR